MIIHLCRSKFSVFIDVHVSIWERKLGDIEEEVYPILSGMPGRPLSISRCIGRTIVLVKILAVSTITCGCVGLQKLVVLK